MWFKRVNKRNLISTLVGIVVMAVVSMLSTSSYTLPGILNLIFIYSIAALALNIVCGCLGEFVLGHAGFLLIGYTVSVLLTKDISQFFTMQLDEVYLGNMLLYISTGAQLYPMGYVVIILVVIVAAILTALIGFLVGLIALGRLKGDYLAIVTLGISLIFVNLCKYDGYPNDLSLGFGLGIRISNLSATPILVFIFLVLCLTLIVMFMSSRFGRNILACRDDNIAAEACGVPVNKTKVMAFTVSSLIAGIAGALLAFVQSQSPNDLGQDMSIKFLIIIVLGGLGSLTGSIIAAILIVLYEQWFCLQPWVPDFIASNPKIVYGIILVVIMLFRSSGLLGKSEFTWNWFYTNIKKLWSKFSKKKQIKEGDE